MAELLKNQFGTNIPRQISRMILKVYPDFPEKVFLEHVIKGYEPLELSERARKITEGLYAGLPKDYKQSVKILVDSFGPKLESTEEFGMSPFLYLPHAFFISSYGLSDFEESMNAQYELTQRFTAEFSIRAFLSTYPEKTLNRLQTWVDDPSPHVRRLVSEGTRPRLPWAPRLPAFQKDPTPVIKLLEQLKDDPELYVRRSVANNLNDIGKDHPDILAKTAQRWLKNASKERNWLIQHALRYAKKCGEPAVMRILGYQDTPELTLKNVVMPHSVNIGDDLKISFELQNKSASEKQNWLVNLKIHYVKASGKTNPKVFKLQETSVKPKESAIFNKKISVKNMTTRKHYPGEHRVEVTVNGSHIFLGVFDLKP